MISVVFIVAMLAVPLVFGLPLLRVPSLAGFTLPARTATAWAGGTLALAALLTALAAMGVAWKPWLVLAIAVIPVVVASRMQAPRSRAGTTVPTFDRPTLVAAALAVTIAGAGLVQFAAGAATSADLSYFWGVKATRFALDRGIDFQWLQQPHLIHLHPNYPPLWPVSLAWGALVAGPLPWTTVPILTWLYVIATGLILHSLLRRRLGRRGATVVSLLWFAVLIGSTARSFSGGSAEGPLLLFVTVAVTTLVVEDRDDAPKLRWLAAGALAGAVLTKSEGQSRPPSSSSAPRSATPSGDALTSCAPRHDWRRRHLRQPGCGLRSGRPRSPPDRSDPRDRTARRRRSPRGDSENLRAAIGQQAPCGSVGWLRCGGHGGETTPPAPRPPRSGGRRWDAAVCGRLLSARHMAIQSSSSSGPSHG